MLQSAKKPRDGSASSKASAASLASQNARKTHDEARAIKLRQMSGTAVGMALKPSRGLRDDIVFAGGKPKDHLRENYRKLKELQLANRATEMEKSKPPPAPFRLKRFDNVQPKLSTHRINNSSEGSDADPSKSRPSTASSSSARSQSASSLASSAKNYIHLNALKAKEGKLKTINSSNDTLEIKRSTKMGELPKYLVDRKLEWAEREKQRLEALKKECIPKGMKLLPEEERLETLNFLEETQQKLLTELSHFALVVESAKMKNKRNMLENKLREIEDAIGVFSRRKVYVNEDE